MHSSPTTRTWTTTVRDDARPPLSGWSARVRTGLALSATALLLAGAVPATAATEVAPPAPAQEAQVTLHRGGPLQYRLTSVSPETGAQLDEGTMRLRYTCEPGGSGAEDVRIDATVVHDSAIFFSRGDHVPCDGERHTVSVALDRGIDMPFTPPSRRATAELHLQFSFACEDCGTVQQDPVPVQVNFRGWRGIR